MDFQINAKKVSNAEIAKKEKKIKTKKYSFKISNERTASGLRPTTYTVKIYKILDNLCFSIKRQKTKLKQKTF